MSAIPPEKLVADKKRPTVETIDGSTEAASDVISDAVSDAMHIGDELASLDPTADSADTPSNEDIWGQTREGRSDAADLRMSPLLAGIEVTLSVEIGSHRLPLGDLMAVDPGQIFVLDRLTSEPVAVLVNGKPFARGEVVAMDDRFGIRLVEMLGPGLVP